MPERRSWRRASVEFDEIHDVSSSLAIDEIAVEL